mmetsp:Transcript_49551/g.124595  ORF Transcript_49551/g.124595 Transcript_49551/m.124595 type:complete len:579 (+) Transcript_49551:191-1927(+)|eukprot:CAMPEP_0177674974 /NCGR_PEP_ID=MMETSP0447-20121125/26909_1 /TAXON_ID=0 /ORGANISM="Stygamoeba regulata, Strain BSH-02190019" /LENGTH=578 /DNA_ID=CAMNT_0019183241 /DNA_START=138 /DNA_END=1874 /DNA_ORIENTATION=-
MANIRGFGDLGGGGGDAGPGAAGNPMAAFGGGGGGGPGGFPFGGSGSGDASGEHGLVRELQRDGDLERELAQAGSKVVVVDFYADWCGPCRQIAPAFAAESEKWTNVVFLKVNVDRMRQTASGIRGIPTFRFYQNQRELETISGQDFRPLLVKYAGAPGGGAESRGGGSTASFVGTARRLGGGGSASAASRGHLGGASPAAAAPVDESMRLLLSTQLVEMGFPSARVDRALRETQSAGLEQALNWLDEHQDDLDDIVADDDEHMLDEAAQRTDENQEDEGMSTTATTSSTDTGTTASTSADSSMPDADDPYDATTEDEQTPATASTGELQSQLEMLGFEASRVTSVLDAFGGEATLDMAVDMLGEEQGEGAKQLNPEEQRAKVKQLLAERRRIAAEAETKAAWERERKRIESGKKAQRSRQEWKEAQVRLDAEKKRREREEDRLYKLKLMKQVEMDRAARRTRMNVQAGVASAPSAVATSTETAATSQDPGVYTECTLQIRFPTGERAVATFQPSDTLADVSRHIQQNHADLVTYAFGLRCGYPPKLYDDAQAASTTLTEAKLVPRGQVLCVARQQPY